MDIKSFNIEIKKIFSVIFFFQCLLFLGCTPKECKNVSNLNFKLLIDYAPIKDTLNIGDTLHITSEFSNMLEDIKSGEFFEVKNFDFFTVINVTLIKDGEKIVTDITNDQIVNENINLELVNYTSIGTGIVVSKHNYENEGYNFEFDLILEKPGLYYLSLTSGLGLTVSTSNQRFDGQCSNQHLSAEYVIEAPYENNFELIQNNPVYEGILIEDFSRSGGFVFHLIE